MLTSHPDLDIPNEPVFRVHMSANHRRYERPDGLAIDAFVSDLSRHYSFSWLGLSKDEILDALQQTPPRSFSDAMRTVFVHHALKLGKTRYGDKTPEAINAIRLLGQLFPEARFIHMIRDGRDVAISHLNVETGIRNVGEVAMTWKEQIERAQRDGGMLGADRYREVRYEELIDDPERILRSVCDFIELQFHPRMLRYYERAAEIAGSPKTAPLNRSIYLPPTRGLRDWRLQMSKRDLQIFESIAGELLERLGYERTLHSITPKMRLRARFIRDFVAVKRWARHHAHVRRLRDLPLVGSVRLRT
jgi:hypothetical protein